MSLNLDFENCRERAVLFLGLDHNKASGRVRKKLLQEDYDPDIVEAVIAYLKEIDYINDERAARIICRRYSGKRLRSRKAMQYVLNDAGVEQAAAKKIAAALPPDEDSSLELLEAYYRNSKPEYAKALRLLARRGYSAYVSAQAVKSFLSAEEDL
ncbi:MAG: RecX family transcriptional regulator [Eubacteriales bacterium]|nr:RecX family transcriptional regulator [Eubacteriales bacterium]MDD4324591.1 RecX family transcriptional regulator [Eubacteriales bacterium]MDD4540885.1 RecX family transcriptional regulator [Eubacteriales bacterium]